MIKLCIPTVDNECHGYDLDCLGKIGNDFKTDFLGKGPNPYVGYPVSGKMTYTFTTQTLRFFL